ncbi:glycosyltransferase family 2 protein [Novosphingobium flavum]|uniref:Glycosyltransferase family 2 protein n=1 Tax=Novosphingobium flavum TaxID=1778672 RepID=A0A7X1KKC4_9SPHN|nr:glycosyltransferase family 2 protein [Novosphingobium flavum]
MIIPYFNEREFLRGTIASLAAQAVRPLLILVDNASTDGSGPVARQACADFGVEAIHLHESRPGKVAALQCGLRAVTSRYVATCDADTYYPPRYLELAGRLLEREGVAAAIAANTAAGASPMSKRKAGWRMALTGAILRQQCLNGGASQVFRTTALKACGGFDPAIWNWVLEDHEIMARVERHGRIVYHPGFICHPAQRPRSVNCTGWTLAEQIRYHLAGAKGRLSFFHDELAPRLRARALPSEMLRRAKAA